jgi:hypothetical protein
VGGEAVGRHARDAVFVSWRLFGGSVGGGVSGGVGGGG